MSSMPALPVGGSKRHKGADGSGPSGSPPSGGSFHQGPPYSHPYQQAPYGQQQYPMQPPQQPGYNMWQHGQQQPPPPYGNQPPPHSHPYGQQPGMYRQPPAGGAPPPNVPPMTPDRSGPNWNGYRGPPPQQGQARRQNGAPSTPQRPKGANAGGTAPANVPPGGSHQQPPPGGPQQYQQWGQPQQPWPPQAQWGGAPPHVWQQGPMPPQPSPPPPNAQTMPQHMYHGGPPGGSQWGGGNNSTMTSPARPSSRLRGSPENGFPLQPGVPNGMASPDAMCKPVGIDGGRTSVGPDGGAYVDSRPAHEEDGKGKSSSEGKHSSRDDKGRGSYRCGRCGVPKKGHICPYQPKLKRRPDEPPPELRNAAVQVEMDEFMTLRRLNIQIQGFPESYATDPHMSDDMCVGEPHMPGPSLGVASIAGGLVAHPGVVGSDGGIGELAPSSNMTSHTTSMQTESAPIDSSEGDLTSKEAKTASTST